MPITLRSQFAPTGLQSQFQDPEDRAMQAEQYQAIKEAEQTAFGQGVGRGLHQTPAMLSDALGQIVEPIYQPASQPFFDFATEQRQHAADLGTVGPQSYDEVDSIGSGAQYIAGKIGENLPNMLVSAPVGIGARIALAKSAVPTLAKNVAAASAGSFPLQMGEGVQMMREDQAIMDSTSPAERLGYAAGFGALTAPMEAADEALLMGRAMGAGTAVKNVFKDGIKATAKDAVKHVAKAVPEAALTEGVPEVAQTLAGQGLQSHLNPNRDTSGDAKDLKEAFFGGWAAGGGTSAVGRSLDVAWSQGRGASEAIGNLLKPKRLPDNLRTSDDASINAWDDQDNEQRNGHAKILADRISNDPDAPEGLRAKAAEFYDKVSRGARDAYGAFTDTLKDYEYGQRSESNLKHFFGAVKDTIKGTKQNAESTPEDALMHADFKSYLDNRSKSARDTETASRLYSTIKQSLVDDTWHELPWHALEDEFGTIGRATEAVMGMRSNLIRAGYDIKGEPEEFSKLFDATVKSGISGEKAKIEVVKTYAKLGVERGSDADMKQVARFVTNGLATYDQMSAKQKAAFDSSMRQAFGPNVDKVKQALGPKNLADGTNLPLMQNEGSDESNDVLTEKEAPKSRFIGSGVKSASKEASQETEQGDKVKAHGGMWNVGHGDATKRKEIRSRMAQTMRQLRSEGNDVKSLTPSEYSEVSGIAPWKVAQSLGKFIKRADDESYQAYEVRRDAEVKAFLDKHPARMLHVTPKGEKNDTEIKTDRIVEMAENLRVKQRIGESRILTEEEATKVKVALSFNKKGQGGQQRKLLREAGFPNASKIENTPNGVKLINNLNHGGNGRFSVHMKDGTERVLSAQDLITHMRDQGHKGTPLQLFLNGLSAVTTNPDVTKVSVKDVWGREDKKGFDNPHFKLTGDLNIGRAKKAAQRKQADPDDIDLADGAYEAAENELIVAESEMSTLENEGVDVSAAIDLIKAKEKAADLRSSGIVDVQLSDLKNEIDSLTDLLKAGGKMKEALASAERVLAAREALAESEERLEQADAQKDEYEGEGQRRAIVGPSDEKNVSHRSIDQEVPTDFNDDRTPKHPHGKDRSGSSAATSAAEKEQSGKPELSKLDFNGLHIRTRPGVGKEHFTPEAQRLLKMLRKAKKMLSANGLPSSTLDVAADYVGRAASAQRAGHQKARDALLAVAVNRLYHALADEAFLTKVEGTNAEESDKAALRERYSELVKAASSIKAEAQVWVDNREAMIDLIDQYEFYDPKEKREKGATGSKNVHAADRYSHREEFLATVKTKSVDELKADGIARKARLEQLKGFSPQGENLKKLIQMMEQELEWGREELKARKEGTTAEAKPAEAAAEAKPETKAPSNPLLRDVRAEAEKKTAEFRKVIEEAIEEVSDSAQLKKNLGTTKDELLKAFDTLKNAWVSGELNKPELVAALRAALKAFRAAVGNAADIVATKVQQLIAAYQQAAKKYFPKAMEKIDELASKAKANYEKASQQTAEFSKSVFEKAFGKAAPAKEDTHQKLVARWARKFKGEFTTGFEGAVREQSVSNLGPYQTKMGQMAGKYVFMVIPEASVNKVLDMALANTTDTPEIRAELRKILQEKIDNDDVFALNLSVLASGYDKTTNYIHVQSAVEGSIGEALMAEKGVLGSETGASGHKWSVLQGLQPAVLHDLLGEFHARLQVITGSENVKGTWNRDTGAQKGKGNKKNVKLNDEGSFASGQGVTQDDMKKVREYIDKVLGPGMAVSLVKDLGGASASWEKGIVKIAVKAVNPMSKAHHEAMHEFFQRLMDSGSPAAEILQRAATSAAVTRQIEQFFHNDPNYAKIKDALKDPHERVAYMFQLWAAGKLNVGPKTEGVFSKIVTWLKNAFGQISESQQAEAIMSHFHEGSLVEPGAVGKVLAGDKEYMQKYLQRMGKLSQPLSEFSFELLQTAQNELIDSKNKGLEKIGRTFSNETGTHDKNISFMSSRVQKTNQMNDRLFNILKGLDEKDVAAALEGLQTGNMSSDVKIAEAQTKVRKLLDDIHTYLNNSGVKVGKVENYFPRVWDHLVIKENKQEFIDLLIKDSGGKMDVATATAVADKLILNNGALPLTEGEWRVGYTPYAAALNERVLDFIKSPEFAKFQRKDMADIMTTYVGHAVHRAEYAKRFGEDGSGLRTMMKEAVGEHIGNTAWAAATASADAEFKKINDALKVTHKGNQAAYFKALTQAGYPHSEVDVEHIVAQLPAAEKATFDKFKPQLRRARRAIMAMEGTLGADINPTFRKWTSGLIVYENMRMLLLSLFSQVIDPLGVMVRGGTVGQAWDTFKRGMAGTVAAWRGKPLEDSATKLAMKLGIIDAGNFLNSQGQAYSSVFMGKRAKWWNDRLFRANGVEGFSQGTRVGAMLAAIDFIKAHSTLPEAHSKRWLAELGLTPDDIKLAGGELDYADKKIQDAIFRWVDSAVLRPNAAFRPSWASDPHFALIFHMKQFTYAFHKVLLERVANEIKHDNYDPMLNMVLTYVPAMIAADFLRGLVANGGEEPPWKRDWDAGDYIMEGVQRAGLLGIPQFGLDVAKWGPAELGGPVIEQAHKATQNYAKAHHRDQVLDEKAAQSGSAADRALADQYNWMLKGTNKTLRQAIPTGEMMKRIVYDPIVNDKPVPVPHLP